MIFVLDKAEDDDDDDEDDEEGGKKRGLVEEGGRLLKKIKITQVKNALMHLYELKPGESQSI